MNPSAPVRPVGPRLGLRANLAQFCLLVGVNALYETRRPIGDS